MPPKATSCVLDYAGIRLGVRSNAPLPVRWLCEFLAPAFMQSSQRPARSIQLTIDSGRYDRLLRRFHERPARPIDCFTMDGGCERHPCRRLDATLVIHFHEAAAFLQIRPGQPIRLLAGRDCRSFRIVLMRLVRELATAFSLQRGDCLLHAAGVVHDGGAVLFAGPKRAGKTTLLLNALRHGAQFLANDRIILQQRGSGAPTARGMPTIVQIRPESLQPLVLTAPTWPYRQYLTRQETTASPILEPAPGLPHMNVSQVCRWLGTTAVAAAPISALIFLSLDPHADAFTIQPIPRSQNRQWLQRALFTRHPHPPAAFRVLISRSRKQSDAAVHRFADIPMFRCTLGPAAYARPNVWPALVAAANTPP